MLPLARVQEKPEASRGQLGGEPVELDDRRRVRERVRQTLIDQDADRTHPPTSEPSRERIGTREAELLGSHEYPITELTGELVRAVEGV
jgi:hypothetical protein